MDRFVSVDADGEPLSDVTELPGGEAFNTAAALAGWGIPVLLTGTALGSDAESDRLRDLLQTSPLAHSIDLHLLPSLPDAVTPVCEVRVFPDGERRMRGRGYGRAVPPPPLPAALLASRPLFVVDPNLGAAAQQQVLAAAQLGCPILAMDFAAIPGIVALSRLCVTSQEFLTRRSQETRPPEETVRSLREMGAHTAIVTLGAAGGIVADQDKGLWAFPAITPPAAIRDTTGAGDTFRAGLAYGLLHALPLRETVRFAAAAAALHCTVLGGASRFPLQNVLSLAG